MQVTFSGSKDSSLHLGAFNRHILFMLACFWLHLQDCLLLYHVHAINMSKKCFIFLTTFSKINTSSLRLMKKGLNNVVLPTLFNVVNSIEHYYISAQLWAAITPNNIDDIDECGEYNIVQSCFHQR